MTPDTRAKCEEHFDINGDNSDVFTDEALKRADENNKPVEQMSKKPYDSIWRNGNDGNVIKDDVWVGEFDYPKDGERAVACLRAMAGAPNPEEMRKRFEETIKALEAARALIHAQVFGRYKHQGYATEVCLEQADFVCQDIDSAIKAAKGE